jgi:hypothetical protein
MENMTAIKGTDVLFKCRVSNVGRNMVRARGQSMRPSTLIAAFRSLSYVRMTLLD